MKEHPILFSATMVRAILAGRKTVTRRVLKPQPRINSAGLLLWNVPRLSLQGDADMIAMHQKWQRGDRLWVRETVACGACAPSKPSHWSPSFWRREQGTPANRNGLWYAADGLTPEKTITERGRWVPGIHMPRWASRITLEVTSVKVERLQDISEDEALAEGVCQFVECQDRVGWGDAPAEARAALVRSTYGSAVAAFHHLWDTINGPDSWDANPWLVSISFKRVTP